LTPRHSFLTRFVLVGAAGALSLPCLSDPPERAILSYPHPLPPTQAQKASLIREIGRLPLAFESNQGQTDSRVRFLSHTADSTLFLTSSEAVFTLAAQPSGKKNTPRTDRKAGRTAEKLSGVALRMQMVGANPKATALTQQPLSGKANYFIGKDPGKWHANVPTFGKVGFQGVYKGVDLVYYGNQKHLEYDFVVAPHAAPKQIQLHFAGARGVHINAAGELVVRTEGRELRWQKPTVYQQDATGKHAIAARFRLTTLPDRQAGVRFALGRYDSARPLIIDPVLLYSTFLGGSSTNGAGGIAVDSSGKAYIVGGTTSLDFPTTEGVLQPSKRGATGAYAAFVTKLTPAGNALVYSTYLGGTDGNANYGDTAATIAIDSSGNAYIAGLASSTDFPTTAGAYQPTRADKTNAFVTKLNPTGTALLYSTYLGGSNGVITGDNARAIAIDSSGAAYILGNAYSTDFPTTPGAWQRAKTTVSALASNLFITKLNPSGTALTYSTYLGGTNGEDAHDIAVDSGGNAYVTGHTSSKDFPTTPDAFQKTNQAPQGFGPAFVTKLNPTGTALVYSTYLGGSNTDGGDAIAIDSSGNAYIAGFTYSTDFPITPGAFQSVSHKQGPTGFTAFVAKLNPGGTDLIYSTYLGGSGSGDYGDAVEGIALDSKGNAYVTGLTGSFDFPTTPGAFQRVHASGANSFNAFVTRINSTGTALVYSSYLGGSANVTSMELYGEAGYRIALDSNGAAYIAGATHSADFPTTTGAFQPTKTSTDQSAFVVKFSAVPIFPDFNNDGYTDLLLQNPTTGAISSWFMQGATQVGSTSFSLTPPADFALVGVGDFSANGAGTLVLQNKTTHQIALWYTSGTNHATIPGGNFVNVTPDPGWKVAGVGDFNKDGRSDLVFQNQTTGRIAIWFMDGSLEIGGVLLPNSPVADWSLVGVGDVDADGSPDLIFQNQTSGQLVVWYFNGTTYVGGNLLTAAPAAGWHVASVGDFNGDGFADLVFTNPSSNQAVVWYLQNGHLIGGSALSASLPTGGMIVGPR